MNGWKLGIRNGLKKFFSPHIMDDGKIIIDYYIRIIMFLYPLFVVKEKLFGFISGQVFLFTALTVVTAAIYLILTAKKQAEYSIRFSIPDIWLLLIFIVFVCRIIYGIIITGEISENDIFYISLAAAYFLLKEVRRGYEYYVNVFLFTAFFVCLSSLLYRLTGTELIPLAETAFSQPEGVSSYILLTSCMSSVFYCITGKRCLKRFYFLVAWISFIALFLTGDIISIGIAGCFLLFIPIVFPATVRLIQRNLLLCFMYVFISGNIPVLQYITKAKSPVDFSVQYSIYLYILLAAVIIPINRYWRKIPKEKDPELIILKKAKRKYICLLLFISFSVINCMLFSINTGILVKAEEKGFARYSGTAFRDSICSHESFFYAMAEQYGLVGITGALCLAGVFFCFLYQKCRKVNKSARALMLLGLLFVGQCFFFRIQVMSAPAYIIFLTFAVHCRQDIIGDRAVS